YAYVRSMVNDGDLSFFNEWREFGMIRNGVTYFSEVTPIGALANHWWIGTSMMAAPFYVVGLRLADNTALLGWASVLFAATALSLACLFLRTHRRIAVIATSLGTPLFWYTFRFPLGTHAAGALCVALIFAALFLTESGSLTGLTAGLAIATRLQHFVLLPAIVIVGIVQRRRGKWWLSAIGAGALPLVAQAIAWYAIYGTPLGPLTRGANLQGVTWMPFQHIALWQVLFSSYHGLVAWSPVVVIAIIGWIAALRRDRDLALACILMFLGEWIANGTLDRYFWGGMSFGGRRFVDLALPFALGIGWFAERIRTWLAVVIATPLVAWSIALMIAAYAGTISLARYVSGRDLWQGIVRINFSVPLHTDRHYLALLIVAIVAALLWPLRRFAVAYAALFVISVAICAWRTPAAAAAGRAGIDVRKSMRFGPLVDERRLLLDEVDWARATGDVRRADATSREIAAIDRLLAEINR
ncbi:MAG TPA: hypothetical protein VJ853_12475, partial [Thermoanaerobaculia bacterium]|nr:hypothetical protein [Thermoanaerobaculia bacterium]